MPRPGTSQRSANVGLRPSRPARWSRSSARSWATHLVSLNATDYLDARYVRQDGVDTHVHVMLPYLDTVRLLETPFSMFFSLAEAKPGHDTASGSDSSSVRASAASRSGRISQSGSVSGTAGNSTLMPSTGPPARSRTQAATVPTPGKYSPRLVE